MLIAICVTQGSLQHKRNFSMTWTDYHMTSHKNNIRIGIVLNLYWLWRLNSNVYKKIDATLDTWFTLKSVKDLVRTELMLFKESIS